MGELQRIASGRSLTRENLRFLLDSIPGMVAYVDPHHYFVYANSAYAVNTGKQADEITGRTLAEVYGEEEFNAIYPYISNVLKGQRQHFFKIRRSDKAERFLEIIYTPDTGTDGKVIGYTIFINDRTSEKNAEDNLLKKTADLEDYINNANIPLHWIDEKGFIKWANRAETEMLGYAPGEYIGKHISEFHADPSVAADMLLKLSRSVSLRNYVVRLVCKNGTIKCVQINSSVYREKDKFIHTRCFSIDITEKVMAQKIAEENEQRLRAITNQSPLFIMMINENGDYDFMNKPMLEMLGISSVKDFRKDRWIDFVHAEDHNASISEFRRIAKNPRAYSLENRLRNVHTDEYRWFLTKGVPRYRPDGSFAGFIVTSIDIDAKKRAEEELILANKIAEYSLVKREKALKELIETKKKMEEMMHVKEQFISNMSHEIRTPMNAIVGFTDLIIKTGLTAEQKQYTEAIKTAGETLLVIINDILDFSKLEADGIRFEKTDFKLSQVLSTMTEMLLPKSIEKNIKLSVSMAETIEDNLIGDPTRLNQVLLNLAGNAVKFTEKGEIKVSAEPVLKTENEIRVKFTVSDTGIGIPEEKHKIIFEPFTQATSDTTRKYGGSGLGLSIARQFIEKQGGTISLQSKVGVGTTFEFTLSFGKGHPVPQPVTSLLDAYEHETYLVEGLNVLLVEDNELNQLLATKVLTNWKWNVELAENGLVALEKLKKKNFDIVLMDIQLPEMDGYEATRKIRSTFKPPKCNIPVMAMTAHAMPSEERKCYEAGMDGYISKPFSTKVLYSRIITILNSVENSAPGARGKFPGTQGK